MGEGIASLPQLCGTYWSLPSPFSWVLRCPRRRALRGGSARGRGESSQQRVLCLVEAGRGCTRVGSVGLAAEEARAKLPTASPAREVARAGRERAGQSGKGTGAGATLCPHVSLSYSPSSRWVWREAVSWLQRS